MQTIRQRDDADEHDDQIRGHEAAAGALTEVALTERQSTDQGRGGPWVRPDSSWRSGTAGLTLARYGHLYEFGVEAVGVAINGLLTRNCGQWRRSHADSMGSEWRLSSAFYLWSLGDSNP
ncbi:hypothetical protein [Mycobacterium sp.]|uniref:hypothetical protein n=1 Tax=Mycobacterium sp. TaxID=1785 RepID=UPI003BB10424